MKIKLILPAMVFFSLFLCATAHAAGPWKGRVIDAETKEPLEGAVVLAFWDRNYRTPTGTSSYFYEAKEVLTDKDGYFEIPSYISINILPIISYIEGPWFIIFKPGYGSFPVYQTVPHWIKPIDERNFFSGDRFMKEGELELWVKDETTPKLKSFKVTFGVVELPRLKTREERLTLLPSGFMYARAKDKIKNYIHLLNLERKELGLKPIGEENK